MNDKQKEEVRLNLHALRMEYFHKIHSPIASLLLDTDIAERLIERSEKRLKKQGHLDEETQKELESIKDIFLRIKMQGKNILNNNRELLHNIKDIAESLKD